MLLNGKLLSLAVVAGMGEFAGWRHLDTVGNILQQVAVEEAQRGDSDKRRQQLHACPQPSCRAV